AFILHKGLPLGIPEMVKDVMIDLIAGATPPLQGGWERALIRQAEATIKCDPAHDPGIEKLVLTPACLPDSIILTLPMIADPIQQTCQIHPQVMGDGFTVFVIEIDCIHQLTIDIELELVSGTVANAHRCRLPVALQMGEQLLGKDT